MGLLGKGSRQESSDACTRSERLAGLFDRQIIKIIDHSLFRIRAEEDLRWPLIIPNNVLKGFDVSAPGRWKVNGRAPDDVHTRAGEVNEVIDVILPTAVVVALKV